MKKPFKVLSAAAMAAVVVVPSIVVPVQAAAATPAAATTPDQLVFTNDAGQQFLVSYEDYADFLFGEGNFVGVLEGKAPSAIGIDGKYVDYKKFQDILFEEENAGLPTSDLLDKAVKDESNLVDKETSDSYVDVTFDKDGKPVYGEPEPTEVEVALEKATTAVTALPNVDDVKATDEAAVTAAAKLVADAKALGADVTALEAKVTALQAKIAEMTAVVSVESVSAINAKTLEVTFNKGIAADATLKVTRGSATVNVQATDFNADRTKATLTFPNKLVAGDYTVTLTSGEATATGSVKIAEEKIESIEITSDVAVLDAVNKTKATVGYKVLNQYGEDISTTANLVTTASPLVSGGTAVAANGAITITNGATPLVNDAKITVTLLDSATGTFTSKVVTVSGESKATSFEVKGLYNVDGKSPRVGDAASNYQILFTAKDQYGNNISQANFKNADIIVASSNQGVVPNVVGGVANPTVSEVTVEGKKYLALTLDGTLGEGTSNINILSKTAGNLVSVPVKVEAALRVETLTLGTPELAVAGEKFKVPFTAVDQNGKEVTDLASLNATTVNVVGVSGATAKFERNLATGKNELVVDATGVTLATGTANVTLIATTPSLKIVQQSVTLRAEKVTTTVGGTKDLVANLLKDQTVTIVPADNIVFKDQYGRDIKPTIGAAAGNYQVEVKSSNKDVVEVQNADNSVQGASSIIDNTATTGTSAKLKAKAKGTATITLTLLNNAGVAVANSSYTYNSSVVENSELVSYQLGTVATIADQKTVTNGQTEELVVYGLDANGKKVQLDKNAFTFTSSDAALTYSASTGKLTVDTTTGAVNYGTGTTAEIPFTVTVVGVDGPVQLPGKVIASKAPQAVTDFKVNDTATINITGVAKESETVVSAKLATVDTVTEVATLVEKAIAVKDQYGKAITVNSGDWNNGSLGNLVISNLPKGKADVTALAAGDTFKVTVVAKNGKTFAMTVSVTAN